MTSKALVTFDHCVTNDIKANPTKGTAAHGTWWGCQNLKRGECDNPNYVDWIGEVCWVHFEC